MKTNRMIVLAVSLVFVLSKTAHGEKQKLDVKVLNRQDNQTDYTYVVPGHFSAQTDTTSNCNDGIIRVSCSSSSTTSGTATPAHEVSYRVRGATFSLLLPDGRIAVVNCESKFAEHMAGVAGNHRDCRVPLVDDIKAEFNGDKAKLFWSVSIDGKKTQSETYKVLAVLDKPKDPS